MVLRMETEVRPFGPNGTRGRLVIRIRIFDDAGRLKADSHTYKGS